MDPDTITRVNEMTIDEYKKVLIDILCKIDRICLENKLTYMLSDGTLLGAVRHKGFIPWDDDIDITMPMDDFKKLQSIINSGDDNLVFIGPDNEESYFLYGKICAKNTHLKENSFKDVKDLGAFVDVFPLFYYPENKYLRNAVRYLGRKALALAEASARTVFYPLESPNFIKRFKRFITKNIVTKINTHALVEFSFLIMEKLSKNKTSWSGEISVVIPAEYLEKQVRIPFEGHEFSVPECYDEVLSYEFGNYMQLPAEEKRVSNHNFSCWFVNK